MILQLAVVIAALLLGGYLVMRCLGPFHRLAERGALRREQAIEQARLHYERVAEYEQRKAAGLPVSPPPVMPFRVARRITAPPAPWR